MLLTSLHLYNFKNHREQNFDFSPTINCFVGNNGIGKTNILDALHYLSVGKSFLGSSDAQNVTQEGGTGSEFFLVEGQIQGDSKTENLKVQYSPEQRKTIKRNGKTYEKIADHIGFLPNVIISPYDNNLISDSGESRRRFMDAMISQTSAEYLQDLIQYQKALQQRNALLKNFARTRTFDADSLEIYDEPLAASGLAIYRARSLFIEALNPVVQHFYSILSGGKENVNIEYQTAYQPHFTEEDALQLLHEHFTRDRQLTYTSTGVHKDDLAFLMNGYLLKKTGSQGQQKSFLIALKLAQISRLRELTGKNPIVLLDDIFDKLDDRRVAHLIDLVNGENFGQIFITDTNLERTKSVVSRFSSNAKIFEL